MKYTAVVLFLFFLASCSIKPRPPEASTPMPTGDLIVIGTDYNTRDSQQNALNRATAFCSRWNAAPSPNEIKTIYQGKMAEEKYQANLNRLASIPFINGFAIDESAYQTTVKYRCY